MRKISGKITVKGSGKPFSPDTKTTVRVIDCSICDGPSITLGQQILTNLTKFPINFEVEYDESRILKIPGGQYALSITIETGERLEYINDTRFSIVEYESEKILDTIDAFVIPVGQ